MTELGNPGLDTNLVGEKAIRAAIASVDSLPGPPGASGSPGSKGNVGPKGDTGETGPPGGGLDNIVEDLTPQLGGNLDMNGKSIGGNTEAQLDDAITKKHAANTDTDLDATFEATFVKKTDNVNVLADITSTGADIEDAVTKKHVESHSIASHSDTTATGTQLNTLVGGGETALHSHAGGSGDVTGPATHAANYVPQWNATPNSKTLVAGFAITTAGKALIDDADAAAQRTTLGLGSAALRNAEDTMTDGSNLPDGAAIKTYGDANWAGSGLWTDVGTYYKPNNWTGLKIYDTGILDVDIGTPSILTPIGGGVSHYWGMRVNNSSMVKDDHETALFIDAYSSSSMGKNKVSLLPWMRGTAGNNMLWAFNPGIQIDGTWAGSSAVCAEFDVNRNTSAGGTNVNGVVVTGNSTHDPDGGLTISMSGEGEWKVAITATDFDKGIHMNQHSSKSGNLILMEHGAAERFRVTSAGSARLPNNQYLNFRNAAGSADVIGVGVNASDTIVLGQNGVNVDLGYGSSANDPIYIRVNGVNTKQVTVGATDSGGTGYRVLRVAN